MDDYGHGTVNLQYSREKLLHLFKEYAFKKGEFPLSSGKVSSYYFNSKSLTLLPEGAFLVAKAIMEKIKGLEVDAVGGAALGAAPIAGSLAVLSFLEGNQNQITFFIDRKEKKEHGDRKRIEGPEFKEGAKIVIVEDVTTTGSSAIGTAKELREQGHTIVKVISLLDREEGAQELFSREGIPFDPILKIDEIMDRA